MSLEKNALIEKLKEIQKLYKNTESIRFEMDNYKPEDHYKRDVIVPEFPGESENKDHKIWRVMLDHKHEKALMVAEDRYRSLHEPKAVEELQIKKYYKPNTKLSIFSSKLGCFGSIALFFGLMAFFALLGSEDSATTITCLVILAICSPVIIKAALSMISESRENAKKVKDSEEEYKKYVEQTTEAHRLAQEAYAVAVPEYEKNLKAFNEAYAAWRELYIASCEEEEGIKKQLEIDREIAVNKIREEKLVPAEAALNEANDLISENYVPVVHVLIDLLQSGRADDLKEAINLYEEIDYRERQLEMQREAEEERRQEEEDRRIREQIEQENQERRRREDEERYRRDERNRAEEAAKEERARQRAAEDKARREAELRCLHCANRKTCTLKVSRPQNCAAFRP